MKTTLLAFLLLPMIPAAAQNCPCKGEAKAEKPAVQRGAMRGNREAMGDIHSLFDSHTKIKRAVTNLPDGVEARTVSDDPRVAKLVQTHVMAMKAKIESGSPIRMWDPLYREIFARAKTIKMEVRKIKKGVSIRETSKDPYTVALLQKHAEAVTAFVEKGWSEMHTSHPAPAKTP